MRKQGVAASAVVILVWLGWGGYVLATRTPGHHIYNYWPLFKAWMDQSNWSSLVVAIAVPGVFTYAFVTWQHRKSRAHVEHHVAELHAKIDAHHQRHLLMTRLLHVRLGGTPEEWDDQVAGTSPGDGPVRPSQPHPKG